MRKVIITLTVFFAITATALAQKTIAATPPTANLKQYPIEVGPLPIKKQADMNLHPVKLKENWTGFNLYRKLRGDGRWVYETLPAGTIVLADTTGNPIYKATCGNRLAPMPKSVTPIVPAVPPKRPGSWPQWFFNLLAALILLALLVFLAWLIYLLFSNLADRRSRGGNNGPQGGGRNQPTPQGPVTAGPGGTNQPPKPSGEQRQPPAPGAGTATEEGKEKDQPQPSVTDSSEGKGSTAKFIALYRDKDGGTKINFAGYDRVTHRVNEKGEYSVSFS
jgi:hypothetical protein